MSIVRHKRTSAAGSSPRVQRTHRRWVAALLVVAAISSIACSSDDSAAPSATGDIDTADVSTNGTLRYAFEAEVNANLFPDTPPTVGLSADPFFAIYDALAIEQDGDVELRIAKSFETEDFTTWTIELNDGVKFSDDTALDAAAVEFNWKRAADPATASPSATLAQQITSITVVDDLTLQVALAEPNGQFLRTVATSPLTFIGSPTAMRSAGAAFGDAPVGAGAFVLDEWVRGSKMVLKRSDSFYGPPAKISTIEIVAIPDETARYTTFTDGAVDMMYTASSLTADRAHDDGFNVATSQQSGGLYLMFNVTRAPFDDIRARKAIAYAFDRDQLSTNLFEGTTDVVDSLFEEGSPFHDPTLVQVTPDRARAQELLDELADDGSPLKFTLVAPAAYQTRTENVQAQLAGFDNIDVEVSILSNPDFIEATRNAANYEAGLGNARWIDPQPLMRNALGTGGSNNRTGYSNADVDAAFASGVATDDPTERKDAYDTVQRVFLEDIPAVFYERFAVNIIYSDKLVDFDTFADLIPRYDLVAVNG